MKLSWLMAVLALAVRASGESCQDLRDAASGGRTEEVQRLLRNGVHVDCRAGWDDRTALGAAAGNNELETAELLLQHGATVDAKSKYGEMPLHEAASNGHEQMAKVLVSHGADVDAKNEWGWTPLRDAARYGHLQVAKLLVSHGADVNAKDDDGKTPLHHAASQGQLEMVKLLISHGANVNAKNNHGETPLDKAADDLLQKAARYGYKQVAKVLISHGADVNAKDEDGDTPLHSAASQGHEQVAKLLISHGADVDAKDEDGDTPLHTAASSGHEQVAKLLVKHGGRVEDAFHERVPIKLLARLVGKGSIRLDKVFRCDEDLMIAFPQEKLQMGAHLTTDCIRSMSKPVAKFWFEHGGNPWMSTPDELRYVYLIKDTEVRKFWQTHLTRSSLLQHTAADPNAWTTFSGGFLAAGFVLLLQTLLQKCQSRHCSPLPSEAATEPSFRMGARLLVAKHLGKSRKMIRLAWRLLEVMVNVVCQFGVVMLLVWWPFFLPFYGLAFACPGLQRWGVKLLQNPPLMVASVTPDDRLVSGLRLVVVSCVAGLASLGFRNPLLASGELLDTKMSFLQEQHIELPWWLPMNPSWLPWWHHVTSLVTSWSAMDLVKWLFWVPTLVLSAMYFVATFLYSVLATIGETGFLQLSHAGFPPFVQRDMVRKVLEEQPSSEADGTPVIAVDGVRFTAEVGFSVYRFFESIWTKVLLVLLDIILDVNTVFTLISAQQYRTAFALQLVVSYSLLQQVMTGQIQKIFEAARASAARGLLRDDLIALLHQEKGFEAYFSLAITSYSLLFAVSTAAQIPVQVFSILLSVHGLATFLYEQVDMELAEDDEDLTSREFLRLEGVDRA